MYWAGSLRVLVGLGVGVFSGRVLGVGGLLVGRVLGLKF